MVSTLSTQSRYRYTQHGLPWYQTSKVVRATARIGIIGTLRYIEDENLAGPIEFSVHYDLSRLVDLLCV